MEFNPGIIKSLPELKYNKQTICVEGQKYADSAMDITEEERAMGKMFGAWSGMFGMEVGGKNTFREWFQRTKHGNYGDYFEITMAGKAALFAFRQKHPEYLPDLESLKKGRKDDEEWESESDKSSVYDESKDYLSWEQQQQLEGYRVELERRNEDKVKQLINYMTDSERSWGFIFLVSRAIQKLEPLKLGTYVFPYKVCVKARAHIYFEKYPEKR